MNDLLAQSVLGIVIGILTTAILFIIKSIWTSKLVPFWVATRYQGVLIDGQWNGAHRNDNKENGEVYESETVLNLIQKAHHLDGSCFVRYKNESKNLSIEFAVNGYMWEGYVTLNFTPKDRRVTSYATALLKLHDGGAMLVGDWLFRNVLTEGVNHAPLSLYRNNQMTANN